MDFVEKIGRPAALEQLAEEASELAQAALKLSRYLREENPTPKSRRECEANLVEEITDVELCLSALGLEADKELMEKKERRWEMRLKGWLRK